MLSHITNKHIEEGIFPNKFKLFIKKSLSRKEDKAYLFSYIIIVLFNLSNYFENSNMFRTEQNGFQKNR